MTVIQILGKRIWCVTIPQPCRSNGKPTSFVVQVRLLFSDFSPILLCLLPCMHIHSLKFTFVSSSLILTRASHLSTQVQGATVKWPSAINWTTPNTTLPSIPMNLKPLVTFPANFSAQLAEDIKVDF